MVDDEHGIKRMFKFDYWGTMCAGWFFLPGRLHFSPMSELTIYDEKDELPLWTWEQAIAAYPKAKFYGQYLEERQRLQRLAPSVAWHHCGQCGGRLHCPKAVKRHC